MTAKYRIRQYQHLVETDAAAMASCEKENDNTESQIKDTEAKLEAIINSNKKAQQGKADYEKASSAWEEYLSASDEIYTLSRNNKQAEAAKLMTGSAYESNMSFVEKLNTLRDDFQAELDKAKALANICTIVIFIVIIVTGIAIVVVATVIGKIITDSITEPVHQIDAAVASLRKGELSNIEMLTYESDDEFGDTIRRLKEAMNILSDYVREISQEVKFIAQGDLTRNGDDITPFLGDFSELKDSLVYILKRFNSTLSEISGIAEQVTHNAKEVESASKSLSDGATEQAGVIQELNATIDTVVDLAVDTAKETKNASEQIGKLAADSAKSAVNTRDLIDKTLVEIQRGNAITITTAEAFNQIISDMDSFAEIAENTMEKANSQAESLEQIGQGIKQLSGVVQSTAASSEENTAISINLSEGADKMHERVNRFKLFKG